MLADEETGVTLTFDAHRYNETQEVSIPDGMSDVRAVARVMHEMGEYMLTRHYSLAYPTPKTELSWSEDGLRVFVIRHAEPRLCVELLDGMTGQEAAAALAKTAAYLKNYHRERWLGKED